MIEDSLVVKKAYPESMELPFMDERSITVRIYRSVPWLSQFGMQSPFVRTRTLPKDMF